MTAQKIANDIKGQKAETYYGYVTIQHKSEAKNFYKLLEAGKLPIIIINTSSAYERRYRVASYIGGEYSTTGRLKLWAVYAYKAIVEAEKGYNSKLSAWAKQNGINLGDWSNNVQNNGYNGCRIWVAYQRGYKVQERYTDGMVRAAMRHSLTDYDEIDKKGLSEYEVRELRRSATAEAMS